MLDSTVSVLENAIARYQATGEVPGPLGARHPSITPFDVFTTQDAAIMIAAGNDRLFAALCEVVGRPDLATDERFATNACRTTHHRQLREILNACLMTNTSAYWLGALRQRHVPCAKINTVADLFASEQLQTRCMLVPVEGERDFKVTGNPVKFRGEGDITAKPPAPALGEHNEKILGEFLGYPAERIESLYQAGAIARD
jgi:CoA:oxalate CoA-transferase